MLDALISLPYVEQVTVNAKGNGTNWSSISRSSARSASHHIIRQTYPLMRTVSDQERQIGTLEVTAGLDTIYARLISHGLSILLSNGLKTFLVALFMLALLHRRVSQRLKNLETDVCRLAAEMIPYVIPRQENDPQPNEGGRRIGRLRHTFRQIGEKLKSHHSELETLVSERTAELTSLNNELREMARTDTLTGLANRRAFIEAIDAEILRSNRFGTSAAVLMIDLNHFKQVNDTYGHEAGDCALAAVAKILKTITRATDFPARFGGEEFVVLLTNTGSSGAMEMAERIRTTIAQIVIPSPLGSISLTASVGMTPLSIPTDTASTVISGPTKGCIRLSNLAATWSSRSTMSDDHPLIVGSASGTIPEFCTPVHPRRTCWGSIARPGIPLAFSPSCFFGRHD